MSFDSLLCVAHIQIDVKSLYLFFEIVIFYLKPLISIILFTTFNLKMLFHLCIYLALLFEFEFKIFLSFPYSSCEIIHCSVLLSSLLVLSFAYRCSSFRLFLPLYISDHHLTVLTVCIQYRVSLLFYQTLSSPTFPKYPLHLCLSFIFAFILLIFFI